MTLTTNIPILVFDDQVVEQEVFANKGLSQVSIITIYQYLDSTNLCLNNHELLFC